MKPVIGIVSNFDVEKQGYFCHASNVRAIQDAGGVPLVFPYVEGAAVERLLDLVSGVVLTGGGDFSADRYASGAEQSLLRVIPDRDKFEFPAARLALDRDLPILGICRGMQLLNVLDGGSIYAHTTDEVPEAIDHRIGQPYVNELVHKLHIERGTRAWQAFGEPAEPFRVNSYHHQAIKELAPGYIVSARADDGIVEAIEAPKKKFVIGVQWHPEWMYGSEPACRRLFESFVDACRSQ